MSTRPPISAGSRAARPGARFTYALGVAGPKLPRLVFVTLHA